jgi:hypothetical protein
MMIDCGIMRKTIEQIDLSESAEVVDAALDLV